jgi:hypothetical protein
MPSILAKLIDRPDQQDELLFKPLQRPRNISHELTDAPFSKSGLKTTQSLYHRTKAVKQLSKKQQGLIQQF